MSYNMWFEGAIEVSPSLNEIESDYLRKFANTDHRFVGASPYLVNEGADPRVLLPGAVRADEPGGWPT